VEYEGEVLCYHFFDEQALRLALQHEWSESKYP
jgi:hypothetical protein